MKELVFWPDLVSLAAVAGVLVTTTTVLLLRRLKVPAASVAQVIQDVDHEPSPKPSIWKGKVVL